MLGEKAIIDINDALAQGGLPHAPVMVEQVRTPEASAWPAANPLSSLPKKSPWRGLAGVLAALGATGLLLMACRPASPNASDVSWTSPTRILSTPTPTIIEYTAAVARRTQTTVLLQAGDIVTIRASDQVKVGPFIGTLGPDGANESQQFWASGYSIVDDFPHGALMYSLTSSDRWYLCGASCEFTLLPESAAGYLEFEVNDNEQGNNSGSFTVEVTVVR